MQAYRLLEYLDSDKRPYTKELGIYLNKADAEYDLLYLLAWKNHSHLTDYGRSCEHLKASNKRFWDKSSRPYEDFDPNSKNPYSCFYGREGCPSDGICEVRRNPRLTNIPAQEFDEANNFRKYRIEVIEIYG